MLKELLQNAKKFPPFSPEKILTVHQIEIELSFIKNFLHNLSQNIKSLYLLKI